MAATCAFTGTASAVGHAVITLHPGQSKNVGRMTVVCTQNKLAKTSRRIILHPGFQVTVNGVRVRCMRMPVPVPTPTPTPTPVPTPPPAPALGTRSNPFPVGTRVANATWALTVNNTNFDAWSAIQAANMFNDPPSAGGQDVMTNFTITYLGAGSTSLTDLVVNLGVVGQGGVEYTSFGNSCGVTPSPREIDYTTIFSGATIQLNLCWQVAAGDVPSLELAVSNQTWLALH